MPVLTKATLDFSPTTGWPDFRAGFLLAHNPLAQDWDGWAREWAGSSGSLFCTPCCVTALTMERQREAGVSALECG